MKAQATREAAARRRITLAGLIRAARVFSIPVSVLPVVLATAVALPVGQWRWDILAASALAAGLLHMAGNMLNDYFDFRSGVDRRMHGDESRPGRVLVRRQLLPMDVMVEAVVALALAGLLSGYVIWRSPGLTLVWLGLAALTALYLYTGPPLRLKYHAMGEIVIFIVFGPMLMVAAGYAQTGRIEPAVLLPSLLVGLATSGILVGNNVRDRQEDGEAHIHTIGHIAGGRFARAVYVVVTVGSAMGFAALAAAGAASRLLLAAPLTLAFLARPLACIWKDHRLPDIDARTARFETILLVLAIVAYVL